MNGQFPYRVLVLAVVTATVVPAAAAEIAPEDRRSGYDFAGPDTRAMQDDDTANPRMLGGTARRDIVGEQGRGDQLVVRRLPCDPRTSMKGVAACYPTFEPELAQPLDLEGRINRCRVEHQGAAPFAWESEDLLALTAFVAYQSRGPPITVPSNAALWPFFDFGRRAVSSPPGSAKPVLQPVSRRQLRKASRRCRHPAGPPDGLPGLSPRMAEFGYAATAAAQLHGRRARRALRVQRAGSRGARALPDGARPRHADRNTGSAPLTRFRCRLGKNRIGS